MPLGPWVDDGAAPCDENPLNCFLEDAPTGLVADCYAAITTDLATVVARCTAGLTPMQVGRAVADSDALTLEPNAHVSIEITVKRHGSSTATLNYTLMLDPSVEGVIWDPKAGNGTHSGNISSGGAARTHSLPLRVDPTTTVNDVVIGFVYWDQSGGARDYLAFNVVHPKTPAPGAIFVLLALAVSLAWVRRTRG